MPSPSLRRLRRLTWFAALSLPPAFAIGPSHVVPSADHDSGAQHLPYRAGELIVKYRASGKPGAAAAAASALKATHGLSSKEAWFDGRYERLALPAAVDVPGAIAMLSSDARVECAEPNFLRRRHAAFPNDPLFPTQWGLRNSGQANFVAGGPAGTPGADLNAGNAWDAAGSGAADRTGRGRVTIAIIDDAFQTDHPDLAANMVPGYDFVDDDADPRPTSASEGHGTAVAGAAAAVGNNGLGVAGAAWNERIMPLRFGFDVASQLRAFDYARRNGAQVINASYGGPGYSRSEVDAIAELDAAGILFVTSAGNQDSNLDFSGATYPANYRVPNVVAVAATNRQDGIASFSTYGPVTVPLAAPGLQIVTTALDGRYTTDGINGTSFSAPYVSGIAALIRDYFPAASVRDVKARLINAGQAGLDPANPAAARTASGRLDAARALNLASGPALVIKPVQTSSYDLRYDSGTQTVPVYEPVVVEDGRNGRLDPGESATLRISLENLWQAATGVRATLSADVEGLVTAGSVDFGTLASGGSQTGRFAVQVPATLSGYRQIAFTLAISADGGYRVTRQFRLELGRLLAGQTVSQTIGNGLYDEFHTWVFDAASLPAGRNRLRIQSSGSNDIDIFVRYAQPAQYSVDLDADVDLSEGDPEPFYFVNVPDAQRGDRSRDGNETVQIDNPQVGSYYVTVVNYDRAVGANYTLRADIETTLLGPDDGGGAVGPALLALLLSVGLGRRLLARRRGLPGSAKA
ncbi:MAG: S8 family serine peptidase [Gammaproteobacteria bacterium]|nr:S8 family serine peptidase [Gammaproteobacteria bacterium]